MYRPTRTRDSHALLTLLEVLAVPASIVATAVVLLLGTGILGGFRAGGRFVGAGDLVLEVVTVTIVVLTALILVSFGALAVVGYRRYFDQFLADTGPLMAVLIPLLGVVVSIGYAVVSLGLLALSWWQLAIVVVFAHALAFRTLTVLSENIGRTHEGVLAGAVAGIPAAVALVVLVDGWLWSGASSRALLGAVDAVGIPHEPWLLVLGPLLVAAGYGLRVDRTADAPLRDRVRSIEYSVVPSVGIGRLLDRSTGSSDESPGSSSAAPPRSARRSSGSARRSGSRSVVPSSPKTSGRKSSASSGGSGAASSGGGAAKRSGDGGSSARSSGSGASSGGSSSPIKGGSGASSSKGGTGNSKGSASNSKGGASSRDGSAVEDGSSTDSSSSDTQIFVDDFGGYEDGESPVETCPDCDGDIPSDGVYTYCPFCGHEL